MSGSRTVASRSIAEQITDPAARTIDATGKLVAPGFIDVHTHYDAQAFWDGDLTPSPLHGITTVIGGNCGFTIAPLQMQHGDYLMRMLARVEGMPLNSLQQGVPWGTWQSFGEWLGLLDGTLAVNAGFMVGHCALRRLAMGERSVGELATDDELGRDGARSCARAWKRARSGSPRRGPSATTTPTATRCRPATPRRTSWCA